MTEVQFWELIERSKGVQPARRGLWQKLVGDGSHASGGEGFLIQLRGLLNALQPAEIKDFKILLDRQIARANTWGLWGAAFVMMRGCSDDGFEYWRAWLVSQGRVVFDQAIANPDSLAALDLVSRDAMELETLLYVAPEIFESKTGGDLYKELPKQDHPSEPTGEPWDEDGDGLNTWFPLLWAKYG